MPVQTSMGAHKLEVLKGDRNTIVDDTIVADATCTLANGGIAGRVLSLNSSGKLIPGIAVGKVPYFAFSGLDSNNSPDVQRDRGMPNSGQAPWAVITAYAAVELSSTEVDTAQAASYLPGTKLTAIKTGPTTAAKAGTLVPVSGSTDVVVGRVSARGYYTGPDGYATVAFYPHFVDGTTVVDA